MTVTADKPAPYASPGSIIEIIERHRNKGLPQPVNSDVLGRAGIPDSLIARTLQALATLDLIDEEGKITPVFEGLRLAPENEYKKRLEEWLNAVYADVLQFVDPASDGETQVRDAFRAYNPVGQQARMVTLFINLFAHAGIKSEEIATARIPRSARSNVAPKARSNATVKSKPIKKNAVAGLMGESLSISGLPPLLEGLIKSLPKQGQGWTQAERDKFISTFVPVLDFCFPIVEANAFTNDDGENNYGEDEE